MPRIDLVQSIIASVVLIDVLITEYGLTDGLVTSAVASSVAIVFRPTLSCIETVQAHRKPRISHCCSVMFAAVMMMMLLGAIATNQIVIDTLNSFSLALVILFMTVSNTEHTHVDGTALGFTTSAPINSMIFILSAAAIISITRFLLSLHFHNLT